MALEQSSISLTTLWRFHQRVTHRCEIVLYNTFISVDKGNFLRTAQHSANPYQTWLNIIIYSKSDWPLPNLVIESSIGLSHQALIQPITSVSLIFDCMCKYLRDIILMSWCELLTKDTRKMLTQSKHTFKYSILTRPTPNQLFLGKGGTN